MDHNNFDRWTPSNIITFLPVLTGCICLLALVAGVMIAVVSGNLSLEQLDGIKGVGVSGGILGVIYGVIQIALMGARDDKNPHQNLPKPNQSNSQDGFRNDL